jgi:RNA polymerase sigma factor (sigma-70 family)
MPPPSRVDGGAVVLPDVCREYSADVRRTISWTLRSPRSPELDDIEQSVYVKLLEALKTERVSPADDLRWYVRAIARNLARDALRKSARESVCQELPEELASPETDPGEEREVRLLENYLSEISQTLLAVYEARFVRRMSQMEAARHLKISRQSLRTLEGRLKREAMQVLGHSEV